MPLSLEAKRKLNTIFDEVVGLPETGQYDQLHRIAHMIAAVGEIFGGDDEEWSKELIQAAIQLAMIGSVVTSSRYKSFSEDRKKRYSDRLKEELTKAKNAIESEDWLQFHKAIREAIYITNEMEPL